MPNHTNFTIATEHVEGFYVGIVLEVPGAIGWARSMEELEEDLRMAVAAINRLHKYEQEMAFESQHIFKSQTSVTRPFALCS